MMFCLTETSSEESESGTEESSSESESESEETESDSEDLVSVKQTKKVVAPNDRKSKNEEEEEEEEEESTSTEESSSEETSEASDSEEDMKPAKTKVCDKHVTCFLLTQQIHVTNVAYSTFLVNCSICLCHPLASQGLVNCCPSISGLVFYFIIYHMILF